MTHGLSTLEGKAAIREAVLRNRADPGFSIAWKPDAVVVARSGELGYTYGRGRRSHTAPSGEIVTIEAAFMHVWRKPPDGAWKCVVQK